MVDTSNQSDPGIPIDIHDTPGTDNWLVHGHKYDLEAFPGGWPLRKPSPAENVFFFVWNSHVVWEVYAQRVSLKIWASILKVKAAMIEWYNGKRNRSEINLLGGWASNLQDVSTSFNNKPYSFHQILSEYVHVYAVILYIYI